MAAFRKVRSHVAFHEPTLASCFLGAIIASLMAGRIEAQSTEQVPTHETIVVESSALGEARTINIYLPPSYATSDEKFPVLFMPDGGVAEDFPHIAQTIDGLIRRGALAPMIVVGIENTSRRRDLTGPTDVDSDKKIAPVVGGSAAFRDFIRDELKPEIDKRFQCNGSDAIVGESLAGLFVIETFLLEPTLFERYIAMDPSLWWNGELLLRDAEKHLAAMDREPRVVWFTSSDTEDIAAETKQLAEILQNHAPQSLRWKYAPEPAQTHATIFRATKESAFEWALWNLQKQ